MPVPARPGRPVPLGPIPGKRPRRVGPRRVGPRRVEALKGAPGHPGDPGDPCGPGPAARLLLLSEVSLGKSRFCSQRRLHETLLSGTQHRAKRYTHTLNQHESFLTQPKSGARVTMLRERNRDTLKDECMLSPRDAQSVTSMIFPKRELENVRPQLRNLKIGQHENKGENAEGEMTADERITHERTGHATYDPRCETCLKVRGVRSHPRKAVAEAAYFGCATVKICQQSAEIKILVSDACESRASQRSNFRKS